MPIRLFLLFLCASILIPFSPASADVVDRVVAIVNDDVITLSDLNQEGAVYFNRILAQVPVEDRGPALARAKQEMLSRLIDKMITSQMAAQMGITVTEAELDEAVDSILARTGATQEAFRHDLASMGLTEEEYRASLQQQILQSKLVTIEVRSKVVVTDEQVRNYYQVSYLKGMKAGGYYILQLGLTWQEKSPGGTASRAATRQKAASLRERAAAGEDFKELAKTYSMLPSAADGGDIGVLTKDEMARYMRDTIIALRPGVVSPLVETKNSYQFFKLLASKEGEVVSRAPFESVQQEIRSQLFEQEMEKLYQKWVTGLRQQAYIKEML